MAKRTNRNQSNLASQMNFRPPLDIKRSETKGTKPLPDPTSIPQVLLLMLVHLCRKILFIDPSIKVGIYILFVFFGSIIADVLPIPRSYFARKENVFNVYFVKWSWGWSMALVGSFVYFTSITYCCGDRARIKKHFTRLLLATSLWFFWTKSFVYVEDSYGYCSRASIRSGKKTCMSKGSTWHSFSISGHTFILIYCTLIIMEEAKALIGWEAIKDHLRNEEHNRNHEEEGDTTPLDSLTEEQLIYLKENYDKNTAYVRVIFIALAMLAILWDVMLVSTVLYFHSTPEKFVASVISVLIWFFTYRFCYPNHLLGMLLPGEGVFRYMNHNQPSQTLRLRRGSLKLKNDKISSFMGMPLNALRQHQEDSASSTNEDRLLKQ